MNIKELREKSEMELQKLLGERRAELLSTRFKVAGRQETNVRLLRKLKKEITNILTILNERV